MGVRQHPRREKKKKEKYERGEYKEEEQPCHQLYCLQPPREALPFKVSTILILAYVLFCAPLEFY